MLRHGLDGCSAPGPSCTGPRLGRLSLGCPSIPLFWGQVTLEPPHLRDTTSGDLVSFYTKFEPLQILPCHVFTCHGGLCSGGGLLIAEVRKQCRACVVVPAGGCSPSITKGHVSHCGFNNWHHSTLCLCILLWRAASPITRPVPGTRVLGLWRLCTGR